MQPRQRTAPLIAIQRKSMQEKRRSPPPPLNKRDSTHRQIRILPRAPVPRHTDLLRTPCHSCPRTSQKLSASHRWSMRTGATEFVRSYDVRRRRSNPLSKLAALCRKLRIRANDKVDSRPFALLPLREECAQATNPRSLLPEAGRAILVRFLSSSAPGKHRLRKCALCDAPSLRSPE